MRFKNIGASAHAEQIDSQQDSDPAVRLLEMFWKKALAISRKIIEFMSDNLSYCGLVCGTCPIFLVTRETDKNTQMQKRAEIARLCKEHYGLNFKTEDITDCDGCTTKEGRLFSGCRDCAIRDCARQKAVENCASCDAFVCEKLERFFKKDPEARRRLEGMRDGGC